MAFNVAQILEKMTSRDKDFRFMATHDLANELEKESIKMDANAEPKVVTQLLKLLDDPANNVQENAVKCLGLMIKRVKEAQATEIVDTLCGHMLNEKKDDLREISNIGLKTVVAQVPLEPPAIPSMIVKRLTPKLIGGVTSSEKPEVKMCCLDILNDMLNRFGDLITPDLEKIQKAVLPQLTSGRPATRKRAIGCLGHLAELGPDSLFVSMIDFLISSIEESKKPDNIRTLVQAFGAISRSAGYRLGKYLPKVVPLIVTYCDNPKFDQDDELRENCFQAFESLILKCPKDITPYLAEIIGHNLKFIKYDPNYADDEEEEAGEEMETDDGEEEAPAEEEEADEGGDASDDDDMSWKVRRSATKCLSAIISTRPDMLGEIYTTVAPVLISRFREREENVKLDIFGSFIDLLRQTSVATRRNPDSLSLVQLSKLTPKIVQGLTKELSQKSVKTRVGAFALLKELVSVRPGVLTSQISAVIPGIVFSLGDKNTNSNLKIEALSFLHLLLTSHPADAFHPHVKTLAPCIQKAVGDHYYRISAEGLRVLSEFVRALRPEGTSFDFHPYVKDIYQACLKQLKAQDIDQEVKECAITCVGIIVSTLGDDLAAELSECFKILLDRLKNEITRVTAVKALSRISQAKLNVDMTPILSEAIKELSGFLRKSNRQLKQSSLSALNDIVTKYGSNKAASSLFPTVLSEVSVLISDADLHLSHLGLHLCASILRVDPTSAPLVAEKVLPQTQALLKSSLLQGLALESLLNLYGELVKINAKGAAFDNLLESLISIVGKGKGDATINKQSFSSIAQCIAVITVNAPGDKKNPTVEKFIKEVTGSKDESMKLLGLLALGEIGRRTDISANNLRDAVTSAFDSPSEEIKQAASFALGNISVGNLEKYVPFVLSEIKSQPKRQYLLLHSLREIIVRESAKSSGATALQPYLPSVIALLFENCESQEEGTRNVVAECLGKLALICPDQLVPLLQEKIKSPSGFARSTVSTAIKYTILEQPQPIDALLKPKMGDFLSLLSDPELNVRRVTLLTFNYAAHNKPSLIREYLAQYMPVLFNECKVKPELIREVDLGPFKHKVDDGLEIRKAAFECMYTLLDTSVDKLDLHQFIANLADGLKDHFDIKMLCHLMLIRLAAYAPTALLESLPNLIEPLRATITAKVNEGAVKQQVERNDEMVKSAMRAVASISKIPNAETVQKFDEFVKQSILANPALTQKYQTILAEETTNTNTVSFDAMDTTTN
eukprot:TRINITY_DN1530_c1_g2_i4.p1 TRINITY_DN1530_c1_g2~~TRINITY_DN1530_c1_g2_i4.p1  ORF type:complete len:1241 (+),score=375.18 TRINITY_DN1530_c1_g2_i4:377-4099(+)